MSSQPQLPLGFYMLFLRRVAGWSHPPTCSRPPLPCSLPCKEYMVGGGGLGYGCHSRCRPSDDICSSQLEQSCSNDIGVVGQNSPTL